MSVHTFHQPAVPPQDGDSVGRSPEFGQREFAFVFERVVLPVVRLTTPSERLPIDWHKYGNAEDSFSALDKALVHIHRGDLTRAARPCERCLEKLVGFSPLYDRRLVLLTFLKGFVEFVFNVIVGIWHCVAAFAIFCVAIWFYLPVMTPQERKFAELAAAKRKEQEAREEAALADELRRKTEDEEQRREEQEQRDSLYDGPSSRQDRALLDDVNCLGADAQYADTSKLSEDERLSAEANYFAARMDRAQKPEGREKDALEFNRIAREIEINREHEASLERKRQSVLSELICAEREYDELKADEARAPDHKKLHEARLELDRCRRRIVSLECQYRDLK